MNALLLANEPNGTPSVSDSSPREVKILLIDINSDNAGLLSHAIRRKFPSAEIQLCADTDLAFSAMIASRFDGVVVHRSYDMDAVPLVQAARSLQPEAIIVAVSGFDKAAEVKVAGANTFLHYDEWLRVGTVLEQALASAKRIEQGPI